MAPVDFEKLRRAVREVDLLPCRGTVVRAAGLTVESQGPPVGIGELCEIRLADGRRVPAEVVGFHNENRVLLPLEGVDGIGPTDEVVARPAPRYIRLSQGVLGRVLDGLGRPMDGRGPL